MIQPSFAHGYFDLTVINPEKEESRGCNRQLHFPFPSHIKVYSSHLSRRKQGLIIKSTCWRVAADMKRFSIV